VPAFLWSGEMSPALEPPVIMAEAPKQQIGSATMKNDGTIVMRLRMTQGAAVGDEEKRYVPGNPDYQAVRAHLPDLTLGKSVPVYNDWN
jgi:hypothetical protein